MLRRVPVGPIADFVSEFHNHAGSLFTDPAPLRRYIRERADGELAYWDVLFASIANREENGLTAPTELVGVPINCERRMRGRRSDNTTLIVTNKQRVASRGVERTGLTDEQIETAQREYRLAKGFADVTQTVNYPDYIYRKMRDRPLLIVHLLAIGDKSDDLSSAQPVVAYSISFPDTELEENRVEYVVNTTWLRENYQNELDEPEMGGDIDRD